MSPRQVDDQPLLETMANEDESLSVAICDLLSRATETSVRELPPLGNSIDPDALDAVFDGESASGWLVFEYAGYDVLVRSNGAVELYSTEPGRG